MLHGPQLLAWCRSQYLQWFDRRHDATREPPEELLAAIYLHGAIDAIKAETARRLGEAGPRRPEPPFIPSRNG